MLIVLLTACSGATSTTAGLTPAPQTADTAPSTAHTGGTDTPPTTTADTGLEVTDTDAHTGDTGTTGCVPGPGLVTFTGDTQLSVSTGAYNLGALEGYGDVCDVSCDVGWVTPYVSQDGACGGAVEPLPTSIGGRSIALCLNVASPGGPSVAECSVDSSGGPLHVRLQFAP